MNSQGEAAARRRPWKGAAVVLGASVAGLGLALGLSQEPPGAALVLLAVLSGALLVLFVAALAWHLAVRLARAQFSETLRESRQHALVLSQLMSDWQWQTDARHHLVRWQAPQGAPASTWAGSALASSITQTLWDRFEPLELPDLRQRLDAQQSFSGLLLRDSQGRRWQLRGQPCLDGAGRFAGYLGVARVLDEAAVAEPASSVQPAVAAAGTALPVTAFAALPTPLPTESAHDWLQALPGPAWLLSDAEPGPQTRLLGVNDAARQIMGVADPAGDLAGQLWRACQDSLPEELREALGTPGIQSGSACGAWWLCLTPLAPGGSPEHPPRGLLSLWPQGAADTVPAALALQAAEQARADQASFSYTVSHDLRAPLRVVEGFTRILKEDYGRLLDRAGNDHLERVLAAAGRMHSMIDSLLALSQLSSQALRHESVDLSLLGQQVLDELKRASPQRQVECHVQPGIRVNGDPTLLRMVLENLLGNAWKYSGKVARAVIRLEAVNAQGEPVFMVSDNGAGFDMRFADRLFGVFQRLHSASDFQGTGVGLASARRIIRRHGGDIWAESEVGQGARFYFTIPA